MIKPLHQEEINDILNGVGVIDEPLPRHIQKMAMFGHRYGSMPSENVNCRCVIEYEHRRLHISVPVWCIIAGCMVGVGYLIGYYT